MFGINFGSIVRCIFATSLLLLSLSSFAAEPKYTINLVSFTNPPYISENGSSKTGLVVELVSELFKRAKADYSIQLMPKKRAIIYAEQTKNTCVLPIERNQEREVKFVWISPVLVSLTGLFQLPEQAKSNRLITLMDAEDFRIGSHLGSASGIYLRDLGFKVEAVAQNSANIYKLQAGRIDYWESDVLTANYISKESKIEISDSHLDFFTQLHAIACNLSTPKHIVNSIRESLYQMYHDGTMDKLMATYKP